MDRDIDRWQMERVVVDRLGPLLGESMARAALAGHCVKLGLETETLGRLEVEQLLVQLRQGMTLFVGAQKAQELAGLLRHDLAIGGDG